MPAFDPNKVLKQIGNLPESVSDLEGSWNQRSEGSLFSCSSIENCMSHDIDTLIKRQQNFIYFIPGVWFRKYPSTLRLCG